MGVVGRRAVMAMRMFRNGIFYGVMAITRAAQRPHAA
jgi:hypothetical protein